MRSQPSARRGSSASMGLEGWQTTPSTPREVPVILLSLVCAVAFAQDDLAEFTTAEKGAEGAEKPETDLSAEFGGALVSGNAIYYSLNGSLVFSHKWLKNKLRADARSTYSAGKADGDGDGTLNEAERSIANQELARKFSSDVRYDRYLTEKDALYVWVGGMHDPFAGYDVRVHEQLGYARDVVSNDKTKLSTEVGFDWAHEFFTEPQAEGNNFLEDSDTYENVLAGRVGVGFSHAFNESVSFTDTVDTYVNVMDPADTRVLNSAALNTKLSGTFSLKLSHQLTFDNVPVEGFQKLDQTSMVTFVASIF